MKPAKSTERNKNETRKEKQIMIKNYKQKNKAVTTVTINIKHTAVILHKSRYLNV